MSIATCDAVRDILPELLHGRLSPGDAAVVASHLDRCAPCREEAALIGRLRQGREPVPPGLEQRILAAAAAPRSGWHRGWGRAMLAAAALGAALLGAPALLHRQPVPEPTAAPPPGPTATVTPMDGRSIMLPLPGDESWPDAAATLDDLSAEELTTLLKELQS